MAQAVKQQQNASLCIMGRLLDRVLLAAVLLLAATATARQVQGSAPFEPKPGTTSELYKWYLTANESLPAVKEHATPAFHCLAEGFLREDKEKHKYSQYGEDGVIEFISNCIGTTDKYYVEFGTETCKECTTRYLRELGWTGLLMDGSHENQDINLHKHFMTAENIADLFRQYKVPKSFDHMTLDVDLNTPYLLRAVLEAGYRPRQFAVEYNRNFAPKQSYMVVYSPEEMWTVSCWFGASGLALERIAKAFNYSLAAFDSVGVNLFFVRNDLLGMPFPHTFADLTPAGGTFEALHQDCKQTMWVYVEDTPRLAEYDWMLHLHPVMLSYTVPEGTNVREWYEPQLSWGMNVFPCSSKEAQGITTKELNAAQEQHTLIMQQQQQHITDPRQQKRHDCQLAWRHLLASHAGEHRAAAAAQLSSDR